MAGRKRDAASRLLGGHLVILRAGDRANPYGRDIQALDTQDPDGRRRFIALTRRQAERLAETLTNALARGPEWWQGEL